MSIEDQGARVSMPTQEWPVEVTWSVEKQIYVARSSVYPELVTWGQTRSRALQGFEEHALPVMEGWVPERRS